jgi:hypothetical protein
VTSLSHEWHNIRLAAATPEALASLRQMQQDRDSSVVVLSLYVPADSAGNLTSAGAADEERATPPLGASNARQQQQQQQQQRGVLVARLTGLVRWWELDQGAVWMHVRPCCGRHPAEPSSPCCKVNRFAVTSMRYLDWLYQHWLSAHLGHECGRGFTKWVLRWWELGQGAVWVHVRPCCGRYPSERSSPCCKVNSC